MPTPGDGVPDRRHALRRRRDDLGQPQPATRTTASSSSRSDGFKLPDEVEARIEELIASGELAVAARERRRRSAARGASTTPQGRYIVFLKKTFPRELTLDGLRVVLDCANGAAYKVGPDRARASSAPRCSRSASSRTAATSTTAAARCSPRRPRRRCASCAPTSASRSTATPTAACWSTRAADVVDGDALLALFGARHVASAARCAAATVVATVMSNLGLERALARAAARASCARRWATATWSRRCARGGYNLGGEQSGHIVLPRPQHHRRRPDHGAPGARDPAPQGRPLSELVARHRALPAGAA